MSQAEFHGVVLSSFEHRPSYLGNMSDFAGFADCAPGSRRAARARPLRDVAAKQVVTPHGVEAYDYLVIATGPKLNYQAVPGLGPRGGYTQSIFSWDDAAAAGEAFARFIEAPGPVVIGAVQGASCFGAAYEFLFNMAYQLKKRGLQELAPLT